MNKRRNSPEQFKMFVTRVLCLLLVALHLFTQWCEVSWGTNPSVSDSQSLIDKYQEIEKELKNSSLGFHLESSVNQHASRVDLYSTIESPFRIVKSELQSPASLCNIVLLDVDTRACTYQKVDQTWLLTLYHVNRFNIPLQKAFPMKFEYRPVAQEPRFFEVLLSAPKGPFNTKDHHFELDAMPLDEDTTFIHLGYSFRYGSWSYFLMKSYFSIFGRSLIGFSTVSTSREGHTVYVRGLRGAVERNVVRYYLAILAYVDTLKVPVEQRFERRISRWYDLTTRYERQLFVMDKKNYLIYKEQDNKNQLRLQSVLEKNQ